MRGYVREAHQVAKYRLRHETRAPADRIGEGDFHKNMSRLLGLSARPRLVLFHQPVSGRRGGGVESPHR